MPCRPAPCGGRAGPHRGGNPGWISASRVARPAPPARRDDPCAAACAPPWAWWRRWSSWPPAVPGCTASSPPSSSTMRASPPTWWRCRAACPAGSPSATSSPATACVAARCCCASTAARRSSPCRRRGTARRHRRAAAELAARVAPWWTARPRARRRQRPGWKRPAPRCGRRGGTRLRCGRVPARRAAHGTGSGHAQRHEQTRTLLENRDGSASPRSPRDPHAEAQHAAAARAREELTVLQRQREALDPAERELAAQRDRHRMEIRDRPIRMPFDGAVGRVFVDNANTSPPASACC